MNEPIEEIYFNWLYSKVASVAVPTPSLTFWTLLRDLHSVEFVWLVPNDDNRAQDGLDIRKEFLRQSHFEQDPAWMNIGCSVLEMLIAFARRAEFQTDIPARDWFWRFMENLNLDYMNDAATDISRIVGDTIDRLVWRTYRRDGSGGLFPLRKSDNDQRKIEIWYQFCEYLIDQEI
jgi:hypothetical protein